MSRRWSRLRPGGHLVDRNALGEQRRINNSAATLFPCPLCGRQLYIIGTHLTRIHHTTTAEVIWELNLPQGYTWCSSTMSDILRDRFTRNVNLQKSAIANRARASSWLNTDDVQAVARDQKRRPLSQAQRNAIKHGLSSATRLKAARTRRDRFILRHCAQCGRDEHVKPSRVANATRSFCNRDCYMAHRMTHPELYPSLPVRVGNRTPDRDCDECHRTYHQRARSQNVKYCSLTCYLAVSARRIRSSNGQFIESTHAR